MKISIPNFINIFGHHVKHRKREPEGVHGQLEGFNRNLRPKAAVANNNHLAPKFSAGQVYYTSLIILSKSGPNRSSSSRENAKKQILITLNGEIWLNRGRKNVAIMPPRNKKNFTP